MPLLECMQITFQCKAPDTAQELSFKGINAFDAAIHCAAISAAERLASTQKKPAGEEENTSSSCPAHADSTIGAPSTSPDGAGARPRSESMDIVPGTGTHQRAVREVLPSLRSQSVGSVHQSSDWDMHLPQATAQDTSSKQARKLVKIREFFRRLFVAA